MNKDKTPYELWYGIPSPVNYCRVFGSNCYIKRNEDNLGKFEDKQLLHVAINSSTKKAYRCCNKRLHKIIESADVRIYGIKPRRVGSHESVENTNDE